MKISCPACSAKYSIADEKVTDKLAKIRCRKCGATIVIDGSQLALQVHESIGHPTELDRVLGDEAAFAGPVIF